MADMISNLVLNASMKLAGEYLDNTTLMALPGTTGPMISDRGDAAKVSLQDLTVHGGDVPTVSRTMLAPGLWPACSGRVVLASATVDLMILDKMTQHPTQPWNEPRNRGTCKAALLFPRSQ